MVVQDLEIFDIDANPLQLKLTDGVWTGEIYFKPVSINLYKSYKLFITENKKFPSLLPTDEITFTWEGAVQQNFYFYELVLDPETNIPSMSKMSSATIGYIPELDNLPVPLEIEMAFAPTQELIYAKRLLIYLNDQLIAKILFYGEGLAEDERFQVHLGNAGIKFNSSDALALRKYDIKDAYPDWAVVNEGKRQLLLNKEEIFPYVGSYKALSKMCEVLGYKDVLQIKEYWKNINKSSPYFNKLSLVDITDLLDDGKVDRMSLINTNQDLKIDDSFQKCGFIALVYQFTKDSGEVDSDGMPIVEKTTNFSSDEMFYKLDKLKEILHDTILPVNVVVKDIIGEWCYFVRFGLKSWIDNATFSKSEIGQDVKISVSPSNYSFYVTEISSLFTDSSTNTDAYEFQTTNFNTSGINVLANNQKHAYGDLANVVTDIKSFYEYRKATTYEEIVNKYGTESSDDYEKKIGCPVILSVDIPDVTAEDLDGFSPDDYMMEIYPSTTILNGSTSTAIKIGTIPNVAIGDILVLVNRDENTTESTHITDYTNGIAALYNETSINLVGNMFFSIKRELHYTLENLKYKNAYEIEWFVEHQTRSFKWNYRLPIEYGTEMPLILPYSGKYDVKVYLHEFNGVCSTNFERGMIDVIDLNADVRACYRVTDQYDERYVPMKYINADGSVNVLDRNIDGLDYEAINTDLIRLSFGKCCIYNPATKSFESYSDSDHIKKNNLIFGDGRYLRGSDLWNATISDLRDMSASDFEFIGERLAGFKFSGCMTGDTIQIGLFEPFEITSSDVNEIITSLNESDNFGISMFNYYLSVDRSKIIAASKIYNRQAFQIVTYTGNVNGSRYTWNDPYFINRNKMCIFEFSVASDVNNSISIGDYVVISLSNMSIEDVVAYLNEIRYADFQYCLTSYGKVRCFKSGNNLSYTVKYGGNLSGHLKTDITGDECLLSLDIDFSDIVNGEATQMQYYVDRWHVQYKSDGSMSGELPVLHHNAYFDFDHCKYTLNTFVIPVYRYVFFTINNIHSKYDCEFILINNETKEQVVRVNNTPCFCYLFDERGIYDLSVKITDGNGNIYTQYKEYFAIVQTFDEFSEYCKNRIENLDY